MNVLEASDLIDTCVNLGIWPPTVPDLLSEQAETWAAQLADVPLDWALKFAHEHVGPYSLRPSQIRGGWEEYSKNKARGRLMFDERACSFQRLCRCNHEPGVCNRGFVDEPREYTSEVRGESRDREGNTVTIEREVARDRWCPVCWDARNARRRELGKDPLDVGVMGPRQ